MNRVGLSIASLLLAVLLLGACSTATPRTVPPSPEQSEVAGLTSEPEIPNPASENCISQGGTLLVEKRGDGGEFGVCLFEDNRQCEEWALLRGECPVGGLKVTGYITPAARYCAITGGVYQIAGAGGSDQEQGTCSFQNGKSCDAWAYWNGQCTPDTATASASYTDPYAYCAAVGTLDLPDQRYTGPVLPDSILEAMIRQGVVTADAPSDFQNNAIWRCMDGQVWVCHLGANLPCYEKADVSDMPGAAMEEFCSANPASDVIPASVTGRATVYQWRCTDAKPAIVSQLFTPDAQGYISDFWYKLSPQ